MSSPAVQAPEARYRWDDFLALDEDDPRELVDGDLLEIDVPNKIHEWIVGCLYAALFAWTREHGGLVLPSGYKVRIRADRGVMPDVQLYFKGHESVAGDQALEHGHPDLVVEVLSDSSRRYDRVVKLGWYASIGVPEYWIVDPDARTLERLVLESGSYRIADALEGDATFAPPSFEGLSVRLGDLWTPPGAASPAAG